jgi:hypothetical protein
VGYTKTQIRFSAAGVALEKETGKLKLAADLCQIYSYQVQVSGFEFHFQGGRIPNF